MRRTLEVLVLVLFLAAGALLVLGRMPMPRPSVDVATLLPPGSSEGMSAACSSCSLDCPFAGGASRAETSADDESEVYGVIADEHPWVRAVPLSDGSIVEVREGVEGGAGRVWLTIAEASSATDTVAAYTAHVQRAGWKRIQVQRGVLPDGTFLAFENDGARLNVLIEPEDTTTRVFLDLPAACDDSER